MVSTDSLQNRVIRTVGSVLGLDSSSDLSVGTALLGNLPEFDSQSVVTILTALEDEFEIIIEDDEIDASIFESIGTLLTYVEEKVGETT